MAIELGQAWYLKAVCRAKVKGGVAMRYLALRGEAGRSDLVKVAIDAVFAHLKPDLICQGSWEVPLDTPLRPGFLPERILYAARLVDGSERYLGINTGPGKYDLPRVAAQAVSSYLGNTIKVGLLRLIGREKLVRGNKTKGEKDAVVFVPYEEDPLWVADAS